MLPGVGVFLGLLLRGPQRLLVGSKAPLPGASRLRNKG